MKRVGFTFIELVVVIAMVTLLIALSLPSLQSSRCRAQAVLCGSNIRQLTLGLFLYEAENGTLPYAFNDNPMVRPPGGHLRFVEYNRVGWWWFNYVVDYSEMGPEESSVVWCPSTKIKNGRLKNNVLCGNYGVNRSICRSSDDIRSYRQEFVGTPLSTGDIRHPGQTLLIVDSGYSLISWWHATDYSPVSLVSGIEDTAYIPGLWINKERNFWPGQEQDAINGRHPNKTVNVGFADGHTSRKRADDLFVEKANDGYKNLHPLWVPK